MIYAFADCQLDVDRYELRFSGSVQPIEPQVFSLLAFLIRERARVVSKEEILDSVWGDRFVSGSALTSRIKAARHATGDDGSAQRVIRTVHGRGYQFVAPVEERASATHDTGPPAQQIRFCLGPDGVQLAYATTGDGPPLVKAANWLSHLDYDWHSPVWRHWNVELSRRFQLVRYDERGCGLSDWDVSRFSFDAWVDDLEAVVDAVGLETFSLLGISQGGPVAIAYAVRHPERVSHLVLLGAFAQGRRKRARTIEERELVETRISLVRLAWGRPDPSYRQIFAARFLPEGTQEEWRDFDELQRRSTSPENAWHFLDEFADIDVSEMAPQVGVPTLILCSRREPDDMFEQSRLLAGLIPGSRLVSLDSANHLLPERDPAWRRFLEEIDEFLPTRPAA
ncbi:alpha/beta fold hydrolase [Phytoactinopolyspora mesophila]|uniref:Alpha/beta fold hydrolase n=1 Tax=Phytoactinopolyspora mesophila TaxID=2650750 RepID=A0A7K3LZE0_9ACTN|nr:alpha/beta fold hydrolase [Phytoactinopolyspora mesophila]NDL56177.1 alpha/beta fold hydrolase [Phytoactinopolyspora mesophila]